MFDQWFKGEVIARKNIDSDFESDVQDRVCELLRSLILKQNSRSVLPCFQRWSILDRLMISNVKLLQSPQIPILILIFINYSNN